MLTCQRHLFDIPSDISYLNCAYMSPLPIGSSQAGQKAVATKLNPWSIQPKDFFEPSEKARGLFAQLIDAHNDDIAIIPSVSYGISLAAKNIPVKKGQKILVLADQFPSNLYPWQQKAKETQAEVLTIAASGQNPHWTEEILAAIDDDTALVACGHCRWTDGAIVDLKRVSEACQKVGAALVIDGTQSVGVVPFNVKEIKPDFLVTGCYKWLLGPYSFGFVYVDPKWHHGQPLEENWITRAGSEDFSKLTQYTDQYQIGARRYDMGERSNFALTPIVNHSLEQILDWQISHSVAYITTLTDKISQEAEKLGLPTLPAPLRAPHLLGLTFQDNVPFDLPARLAVERVFVSLRGRSIRVAPHVYNNSNDIDRFINVLKSAL